MAEIGRLDRCDFNADTGRTTMTKRRAAKPEPRKASRGIPVVDRRTVLIEVIRSGCTVFATILANPMITAIITKADNPTLPRHPYNPSLVKQLFSDFKQPTRFTPGFAHYLFQSKVPPDDKAAMDTIGQLCSSVAEKLEKIDGYFQSGDLSGTFVCTGSPVSNLLPRLVMQYDNHRSESDYGLIRARAPVLDLRYEYQLDPEFLSRSPAERVGRGQVLNWAVRDVVDDEMFWPKVNDNTFLRTDYLLVTVAPNFLNRDSFERGEKIIIFGGTHGPGTRAVDLLFRDEFILSRLLEQVRGMQYWQALLEVDLISYENDVDTPVSLNKNIRSCPININDKALRKWFDKELVSV